jgi:hypothetical protein
MVRCGVHGNGELLIPNSEKRILMSSSDPYPHYVSLLTEKHVRRIPGWGECVFPSLVLVRGISKSCR